MWLCIVAFFVYTGIEACFWAWTYSLLAEGRGLPVATAGAWATAYWGALTAGRVGFGFIVGRVPLRQVLRWCNALVVLGATLVWLDPTPALSLTGLLIAGIACGPVFPSLIAETPSRLGPAHTPNAVGFQVAAAASGQSLLPSAMGALAARSGFEAIPLALVAAAGLLVVTYEMLSRAGASLPSTVAAQTVEAA